MNWKAAVLMAVLWLASSPALAQTAPQTTAPGASGTVSLTLADALTRAKANNPQFQAAVMRLGLARQDRVQARAALLPGVDDNYSFIYT